MSTPAEAAKHYAGFIFLQLPGANATPADRLQWCDEFAQAVRSYATALDRQPPDEVLLGWVSSAERFLGLEVVDELRSMLNPSPVPTIPPTVAPALVIPGGGVSALSTSPSLSAGVAVAASTIDSMPPSPAISQLASAASAAPTTPLLTAASDLIPKVESIRDDDVSSRSRRTRRPRIVVGQSPPVSDTSSVEVVSKSPVKGGRGGKAKGKGKGKDLKRPVGMKCDLCPKNRCRWSTFSGKCKKCSQMKRPCLFGSRNVCNLGFDDADWYDKNGNRKAADESDDNAPSTPSSGTDAEMVDARVPRTRSVRPGVRGNVRGGVIASSSSRSNAIAGPSRFAGALRTPEEIEADCEALELSRARHRSAIRLAQLELEFLDNLADELDEEEAELEDRSSKRRRRF
ncbi:hypothetical protein BD779DRAFT_1543187 [Infundibulicybe gibba]|nr:hypothetical protein BD779DRAFT_1543187 [Infundibulicybe gibba]